VNGVVFLNASTLDPSGSFLNQRLWVSNGAPSGTTVLDTNPNTLITADNPTNLINVNGTLFFTADGFDLASSPHRFFGRELWRSNGSLNTTFMVSDILSGPGSSSPINLVNLNGKLLFAAEGGGRNSLGNVIGRELWMSDGIPGGMTAMVKEINPTGSSGTPGHGIGRIATPTNVNGTLFLWADDGTHGFELWTSDGIPGGTTKMVKDINPSPGASSTSFNPNPTVIIGSRAHRSFNPVAIGNTLYFAADDGTHGIELWKSDGSGSGTVMVGNINVAAGMGSNPSWLTVMNGKLFFTADAGGTTGRELWMYDPQTDTAQMVRDIWPGPQSSRRLAVDDQLAVLNGTLYFAANDGLNGTALWRSNGTSSGTTMVVDLNPATNGSSPVNKLTVVGDTLFFVADNGMDGVELFGTDGTALNTSENEINPGPASSITLITGPRPIDLVSSGGVLYLPANGGMLGDELWNSAASIPSTFDTTRTRPLLTSQPPPLTAADLSLSIVDIFDPEFSGEQLLYTYEIRNNGPGLATDVTLLERFDPSLTFLATSLGCFQFLFLNCDAGNIPAGQTRKFWTLVRLPTITSARFIASSGNVDSLTPDPVPGNNAATQTTTVFPLPITGDANLAIEKFDTENPVLPGTDIHYTIQVINHGPVLAEGVVVRDALPATVRFRSAASSPIGACSEVNGAVTCNIGPLALGASIQIEIVATAPTAPQTVTNTATVTGIVFDPDLRNNSTSELTVVPEPTSGLLILAALLTLAAIATRRAARPMDATLAD